MDAPVISPSYSVFDSAPQAVTITSTDPSATIYFTTDGSTPNPSSSTVYTGSFNVSTSTIVKAIAVHTTASPVATSYIQIDTTTAGVSRSGLFAWLKGDNGVITSSSNVTNWTDVSGNGNDASQSNSSNQPTFVTSAINGLPVVNFSGSSQFLQFPSGFADFTAGLSIFLLLEPTGFTRNDARILDFGNNSNLNSSFLIREQSSTSFAFDVWNSSGSSTTVVSSSFTQNSYQLIEAIHNGTSTVTLYNDSVLDSLNYSMFSIDNTTRTGNYIGRYTGSAGWYFEGNIAELLIYNRALTASDKAAIEAYLSTRYKVPIAPVINPSYSVFDSAPQAVTIASPDSSAVLRYTTNGSTPTSSSPVYSGSFNVSSTTTVKAIAEDAGLTSSVSSSIIQIDSTSSDVPRTGLICWLKADNGVITSSSNVTNWIDVSGTGSSARQSNPSYQPTYVSNAVNSLPVVNLSGASQFLQLHAGFADFTAGVSIFLLLEPTGFTRDDARILDFGNDSNHNSSFLICEPSSSSFAFDVCDSSSNLTTVVSSVFIQNAYQLIEAIHDGSSTATIYSDAIQEAQNTSMHSIDNTMRIGCYIGRHTASNGWYFEGNIAEILLYDRALTNTQRQSLEGYFSKRYAIPVVLPPTIDPSGYSTFASTKVVTITPAEVGATLHVTIDGSAPTPASPVYTAPFAVTSSTTIKAISAGSGGLSHIATSFIQIDPTTASISRDGLMVWLKADHGPITSSSNVTSWTDISGNGNDAVQSNSSNQPTLVTNAINGLSAVEFSGASQFLQFPSGFADFSSGLSIFLVLKPTGLTTSDARILDFGNNSNHDSSFDLREPSSSTFAFDIYDGSSNLSTVISPVFTQNAYQLIEVIYDGASAVRLFENGTQPVPSSPVGVMPNTTRSGNYIGRYTGYSGFYYDGQIAELFIYQRALNELERRSIEFYLAERYLLSVPVPNAPLITLPSGTLSTASQVAICGAYNGTVRYTVDGSTPSISNGTAYSEPLSVMYSQVIKAIDVVDGIPSTVASASYNLDSTAYPAPNASDTTPLVLSLELPMSAQ